MAEVWAPSLADVGGRIPTRTRDQTAPGNDTLKGTFDETTVPTADQVTPIINDAATTVLAAVTAAGRAITTAHHDQARVAAAWRAAADVELAYPERDADIREVYDRLNARAALELERLLAVVDETETGGTDALLPVWAMPDPVAWGDTNL